MFHLDYNVLYVIFHKYVNAHQTSAYVCMNVMFQKFSNKINNNLFGCCNSDMLCYVGKETTFEAYDLEQRHLEAIGHSNIIFFIVGKQTSQRQSNMVYYNSPALE